MKEADLSKVLIRVICDVHGNRMLPLGGFPNGKVVCEDCRILGAYAK